MPNRTHRRTLTIAPAILTLSLIALAAAAETPTAELDEQATAEPTEQRAEQPTDGQATPSPTASVPATPAAEPLITSAPAEPTPEQPAPAEPALAEPTPAKPAPAEPTQAEPAPAEPTQAEPAPAEPTPGQLLGVKTGGHPDWFKESFLELADDVSEATDAGKHVILFMDMNGCPYCYKMATENFDGAPYRDWLQQHFDVIAINIRGDREVAFDAETTVPEKALATQLGVRYTPTVIFLNDENRPVARTDGYRNVDDFKQVLDYVAERAYLKEPLPDFLAARKATDRYQFREHPVIQEAVDVPNLADIADGPLALLFEDTGCVACAALHDGHLADPAVQQALADFAVVRLDAAAGTPIIAPDGTETTSQQFADDLGVTYRPTLVLFDDGRELARIESMLYRYHFIGVLEYVGQRHYREYPDSPFDYINQKTAALMAAGEDVSIADE